MKYLLAASALIQLFSCGAFDLGDESPDEVTITNASLWTGGISDLITAKCAGCHTTNRNQFVPANTPTTFDNITDEAFFTGQFGTVTTWVCDQFEPMPPLFATPLTTTELNALLTFMGSSCP